jgi:hypothetical protein
MTTDEFFKLAFEFVYERSIDKSAINTTFKIFEKSIIEQEDYTEFLTNQLRAFSIFKAEDSFQKSAVDVPHCVSFVDEFFMERPDKFISSYTWNLEGRITSLLRNVAKHPIKEGLKPGDIIVYKNNKRESTHVAVFIGKIDTMNYVVSKWGSILDVYTHPMDSVSENYGTPFFYKNHLKLNKKHIRKLNLLNQDVHRHLKKTSPHCFFASKDMEITEGEMNGATKDICENGALHF